MRGNQALEVIDHILRLEVLPEANQLQHKLPGIADRDGDGTVEHHM